MQGLCLVQPVPGHIYHPVSLCRAVGTWWPSLWAKIQGQAAKMFISQAFSRFCPAEKADRETTNSAVVADAENIDNSWVVAPNFQPFLLFSPTSSRLREKCRYYFYFFFIIFFPKATPIAGSICISMWALLWSNQTKRKTFQPSRAFPQQDGRTAVASLTSS